MARPEERRPFRGDGVKNRADIVHLRLEQDVPKTVELAGVVGSDYAATHPVH